MWIFPHVILFNLFNNWFNTKLHIQTSSRNNENQINLRNGKIQSCSRNSQIQTISRNSGIQTDLRNSKIQTSSRKSIFTPVQKIVNKKQCLRCTGLYVIPIVNEMLIPSSLSPMWLRKMHYKVTWKLDVFRGQERINYNRFPCVPVLCMEFGLNSISV